MTAWRRLSQAMLLAVFVAFLAWPQRAWLGEVLFRADPLLIPTALMLDLSWGASLLLVAVLLVVTLLWGRVFCGWICPLGACIDSVDHVVGVRVRLPSLSRLKYHLLLLLLAAAAGGVVLTWVIDPINWAARVAGFIGSGHLEIPWMLGLAGLLLLLSLTTGRRGFCRLLCPVGALLGSISRLSLFRRRHDAGRCTSCQRCVRECRMAAIGPGAERFDRAECVHCRDCDEGCPEGALGFSYRRPGRPEALTTQGGHLVRRQYLLTLGGGAAAAVALRLLPGHTRDQEAVLRPPGCVEPDRLADLCVRCGSCLRVCPSSTLVSSTRGGWALFQTPELVARRGGCLHGCNGCGQVCPTGAIRPLDLGQKRRAVIGRARIDTRRCRAHRGAAGCVVCAAACPFEAIALQRGRTNARWGDAIALPSVVTDRCTGCGLCEAACPVSSESAIRVHPGR